MNPDDDWLAMAIAIALGVASAGLILWALVLSYNS